MVDGEGVDDVSVLVADALQLPDLFSNLIDVPLQGVDVGQLALLAVDVVALQVLQVLLNDPDIVFQCFLHYLYDSLKQGPRFRVIIVIFCST